MTVTKVKISGFNLQLSDKITVRDFFSELQVISQEPSIRVKDYTARIYTAIVGDLIVGLVLTFKGEKQKLASEINDDGKLIVNRVALKKNQTSTEASLFCLNPDSLSGVYTHYSGSATASTYGCLFKKAEGNIKKDLIERKVNEITNYGESGDAKKALKTANNHYSGSFDFIRIFQEKDLQQIISSLKSLSEVEVITELGIPKEPMFQSLNSIVKKTTQTVTFIDRFRPIENLKRYLPSFVDDVLSEGEKNHALKLIGKSLAGQKASYILGNNIEEFGSFIYDEYIDGLPFDIWDQYPNCNALATLIELVKKNSITFGDITEVTSWYSGEAVKETFQSEQKTQASDTNPEKKQPQQFEICLQE